MKDVVIYRVVDNQIVSIVGRNLRDDGFYTPEKRLHSALAQVSERYDASIVEAGKYDVGDFWEETK